MDLSIYLNAQDNNRDSYTEALNEIRLGKKRHCWIWYIFPILKIDELMADFYSEYFSLENTAAAEEYISHPILGIRLVEITSELLLHNGEIVDIIGSDIDKKKLWSCMTLFASVAPEQTVFEEVLNKFYDGKIHEPTAKLI